MYIAASLDEDTFRRIPEVGAAPDMIVDDLPSNLDYLDESFSATAGLREITDDDLDDFGVEDSFPVYSDQPGVVSKHGGETIRMFQPLKIVEHHFDALPPDANDEGIQEASPHIWVIDVPLTSVQVWRYYTSGSSDEL